MKVGLAMGSYNPPHLAHETMIRHMLSNGMDQVWIVPSFAHPYGKKLLPFEHRVEMCRHMAGVINGTGNDGPYANNIALVSDIEKRLGGTCSLTCDVVECLIQENPGYKFYLGCGTDVKLDMPNWEGFQKLDRLITGYIELPRSESDLSSSAVRASFQRMEHVSHMVHSFTTKMLSDNRELYEKCWGMV